MKLADLSVRAQELSEQATALLATIRDTSYSGRVVDAGSLAGFRASTLSFISMVYGKDHSHYTEFDSATHSLYESSARKGVAILLAIKNEIDGGWIFSTKKLIVAEVFSDFIEMAEHLLSQNYKDPAAVVIGSVLEEKLRHLCKSKGIDIEFEKDGNLIPKKADRLNSDLASSEVYTKLDQKAVTVWLDLRNKAAHGKYHEYNHQQVAIMVQGVIEFISRVDDL